MGRDDRFEAVHAERSAFSELMVRSLFMEDVTAAVADAWRRFWPGLPPASWERAAEGLGGALGEADSWDVAAFAQWAVHDAPLAGLPPDLPLRRNPDRPDAAGVTLPDVIAGMLDQQAPGAERAALRLLSAWRSSLPGLFRVTAALPGYQVQLEPLCGTGSFLVLDAALSRRVQPDVVVALRLRPIDGRYEAASVCYGYPPTEADALRAFATRELATLRRSWPDADWPDLWRWRGERLHHYAVERQAATGGTVQWAEKHRRRLVTPPEPDGTGSG